eukprot:60480-Prymnesium_polylepis.1
MEALLHPCHALGPRGTFACPPPPQSSHGKAKRRGSNQPSATFAPDVASNDGDDPTSAAKRQSQAAQSQAAGRSS